MKNSRTQEEGLQNDIELTKNMENNLNIEELQTVEKNNADLKKNVEKLLEGSCITLNCSAKWRDLK